MKHIKVIYIFLFISFYSTGCVSTANDPSLQIVPPKNNDISIQGTWEVSVVLSQLSTAEEEQEWMGKTIMFSAQYAMVGEDLLINAGYQVKQVAAEEYLLYHYKAFPEGFNFLQEEIEIITVTNQDVFFCEILKEKDEELILKVYNDSFVLKKVSDEVDEALLKQLKEENSWQEKVESFPQDKLVRTGVLVGLRQTAEEQEIYQETQSYRTLWIASENRNLHTFLQTEDIFFPRRNGFWKMEVKRIIKENKIEEFLVAYNILIREKSSIEELGWETIAGKEKASALYRRINYISNDYVSIEERSFTINQGDKVLQKENLHVLIIDSLPMVRKVNILDLLGKAGVEAIENGRKRVLSERKGNSVLQREDGSEDYGLERRLGHWLLKGRINFFEGDELTTADYNINLIPPSKLVFYDELSIPWTTVKDKVPTAVDLYTSPNKDIALVVTKNEIMVFGIEGQKLQQEPLEKIPLREEETVIMAEWAIGPYVENWGKTLENYINNDRKIRE